MNASRQHSTNHYIYEVKYRFYFYLFQFSSSSFFFRRKITIKIIIMNTEEICFYSLFLNHELI